MRKIEFRGKAIEPVVYAVNSWIYGSLVNHSNGEKSIIDWDCKDNDSYSWHDIVPETIGQYTGLKDCNGKKVFEGDIVKHVEFGIKEIKWGSDYSCLDGNKGFMYNNTMAFLHDGDSNKIQVVGNIFDNSELLENV